MRLGLLGDKQLYVNSEACRWPERMDLNPGGVGEQLRGWRASSSIDKQRTQEPSSTLNGGWRLDH